MAPTNKDDGLHRTDVAWQDQFPRESAAHLLEGVQIVDRSWRYHYLNDAALRHARRGRDELIGKTMMEVYPGIDSTPLFEMLQSAMVEGTTGRIDNEFVFPDGTRGWFELRAYPVQDGLCILSIERTRERVDRETLDRLHHVLDVIRAINRLVLVENDPEQLMQNACDALVASCPIAFVWMVRTNGPEEQPSLAAVSGDHVVTETITSMLARGELPSCLQRSLSTHATIVIENPTVRCTDCPLSPAHGGNHGLARVLTHGGSIFGAVMACTSSDRILELEERWCFDEVVDDIAFGLAKIARQDALEESRRRMETLYDNLPGMVYRCLDDPAWTMLSVSSGSVPLTGYLPTELEGRSWPTYRDLIHPRDRRAVRLSVDEAVQNGRVFTIEYRILDRNGSFRWVWEQGCTVDTHPSGYHVLEGYITDISERKIAEDELVLQKRIADIFLERLDEEVYAEVLEVVLDVLESPLGAFGYLDDDGALVIPSLTRAIWEECRVPGKRIVVPPDRWGDTCWASALRDGSTRFSNDSVVTLPEGHLSIRRHVTSPILFRDEVIGLLQVANKATDYSSEEVQRLERIARYLAPILDVRRQRDRALALLKEREGLLEASQHLAKVGGWSYDLVHDTMYWTDESYRIHDIERQSIPPGSQSHIEKSLECYLPSDKETIRAAFEQCVLEGISYDLQFPFVSVKGRKLWIRTMAEAIERDGQIVKVVGTIMDITAQKQRERELEELRAQLLQAQKMEAVGRLAGGVAHDFNNLMTVVTGYCSILRRKVEGKETLLRDIEKIETAGKRATELTGKLLAFSRKKLLSLEVHDASQLIDGLLDMIRRLISEDIELRFSPSGAPAHVRVDKGQTEHVIMNMVVNARDAMPHGGRLTIEVDTIELVDGSPDTVDDMRPGAYVRITITDTGEGMDEVTLSHLFEPFFTTKEVGKGTGLGLAMVYGVVTQSDGYIRVKSRPGQGASFELSFPRVEPDGGRESSPTPDLPPQRGIETILVVEDDDDVRNVLISMLEESGYELITAADGEEALHVAQSHEGRIDLLLTDVIMPRMSGKVLADTLRARIPGLRVLFMSGYTDNAIHLHGVLDHGLHFIEKPFTASRILFKIRSVLDG